MPSPPITLHMPAVVAQVLEREGELSWDIVAARMSVGPAAIGRISGSAGRPIRAGERATFTLVDPEAEWTVTGEGWSMSANTPFLHSVFSRKVVATAIGGNLTHGAEHLDNHTRGNL
jgi:dihydroorotase